MYAFRQLIGSTMLLDAGGIVTSYPLRCISFLMPNNFIVMWPLDKKTTWSRSSLTGYSPRSLLYSIAFGARSEGRAMIAIASNTMALRRRRFVSSFALSPHCSNSVINGVMGITDDLVIGAEVPDFTNAVTRRRISGHSVGLFVCSPYPAYSELNAALAQRSIDRGLAELSASVHKKSAKTLVSIGGNGISR